MYDIPDSVWNASWLLFLLQKWMFIIMGYFMKISFGFAMHFKHCWFFSNSRCKYVIMIVIVIVCAYTCIYKTFTKVWFDSVLPIDAVTWTVWMHNIKTLKSTKTSISLWKRRQSLGLQLFTQSINAARAALELRVPWTYSHLFQNQMLHGKILLPSSY